MRPGSCHITRVVYRRHLLGWLIAVSWYNGHSCSEGWVLYYADIRGVTEAGVYLDGVLHGRDLRACFMRIHHTDILVFEVVGL